MTSKLLKNRKFMAAAAFLLPLLLLSICLFLQNIYPFGDTSILEWDAKLQHKDYYSYLWDVLHGNASYSYSFSKSLGGRMIGITAFYISSLSNFLLLFISKSQIPQYLSFMFLLRLSLCGLTSYTFIRKRFQISCAWSLLLSTSYAMMEYNVVYCRNLMWLDGVMLLPLVCLGAWYCIENRRKVLLPVFTGLAIICNWYTGYMVCFMTVLYCLFELFFLQEKMPLKKMAAAFLRFCLYLLLGVGISALVLLPSCISLMGGKASFQFYSGIKNMSPLHSLSGLAMDAAYNKQNAPILYCGGICLLIVIHSFWCKGISLRKKAGNALLLLFMMASFILRDVELIWTAYVRSTSYYFRFAFVFAFCMVLIAAASIREMDKASLKFRFSEMAGTLCTVILLFLLLGWRGHLNSLLLNGLYLVLLVLYGLLLTQKKKQVFAYGTMLILLCAELCKNAAMAFRSFNDKVSCYETYYEDTAAVIQEIDSGETDFYRLEKSCSYLTGTKSEKVATGESFIFGYNSIEHYSSAYDRTVDRFLANVGYSDYPTEDIFPCETYWNDSLPLMETLLGIKYVLHDKPLYGYTEKTLSQSQLPSGYACYEIDRSLPLAYAIDKAASAVTYTEDPFANQNAIASAMTGQDLSVYMRQDVQLLEDDERETYRITAGQDGPLYIFADGSDVHRSHYAENCEIYADGTFCQISCGRFLINALYLGEYQKGDTVTVEIRPLTEEKEKKLHTLYAYTINEEAYDTVYRKLSETTFDSVTVDDGHITASGDFSSPVKMFFSVPYDKGWSCKIDGQDAEIQVFADTFCTVDVPEGSHTVTMEYSTPGSTVGILVSLISILLLLGTLLLNFRKRATR